MNEPLDLVIFRAVLFGSASLVYGENSGYKDNVHFEQCNLLTVAICLPK